MTCTDPEPYTFAVATEFEPCTFAVATEFDKVVNAVCAPDGRAATTKEDCERAAKSLYPGGFRGVHVSSRAETPFGCGYSGADVHFNTKSDSTAKSYPTNWGSDRGSICRVTKFDKVVNAVCAPDGRTATTKEECERAAKSLYPGGFKGVHVSSRAETPFGCGYSGADVHFNTKSDSTATSYPTNWGADRGSICRAVTPACSGSSSSKSTTGATLTIIVPVVVAAVLLVAAVLYLVRKRRVAALQLHRQSSMPTIGGDDEAEVEA